MAIWYVRPDTSHSGTRNGTSYATAWGGWTEIVWGGSGVAAGDTLYVCGAHTFSAGQSVGAHGGTTTNRTTIRGDFPADPGSILCVGNVFLTQGRANTILRNLTFTAGTSHALFVTSAATLSDYIQNTFNSTAANSVFSLYGDNGQNHADVLIQGNTFRCSGAGLAAGKAATIEWFMSAAGGTSTLTRVKIKDNLFENCNTAGTAVSVMQLRVDNAASTSSSIVDLEVDGNIFRTYKGVAIRLRDDHTGDTYDRFKGVKVRNNQFYDGGEATTPGWGGCISIGSFGPSTTVGFGLNELSGNVGYRQIGAAGGINCFYGSYYIADNYFDDFATNTIDGNAILVDLQCRDVLVLNNRWRNLRGKAGVVNSGVGIMVLNATNIRVFGNVGYDMKVGIHIGDDGTGQSAKVHNNTLWGCTDYAIYMHANADRSNVSMYNNTFQGTGYSVYNNSASAWSLENYNNFDGFASGTYQHTLGANDKTESMNDYVRPDGSLKVPSTATLATLGTDNPLALSGTYVSGVTLANGRQRPGFVPIGAYMAVLPRTART
jgi:hypothetical protein